MLALARGIWKRLASDPSPPRVRISHQRNSGCAVTGSKSSAFSSSSRKRARPEVHGKPKGKPGGEKRCDGSPRPGGGACTGTRGVEEALGSPLPGKGALGTPLLPHPWVHKSSSFISLCRNSQMRLSNSGGTLSFCHLLMTSRAAGGVEIRELGVHTLPFSLPQAWFRS